MAIPYDSREIVSQAQHQLATGAETGFVENLFSAFDQFRRENLSVSEQNEFMKEWKAQVDLAKQHGFDTPQSPVLPADDGYLNAARERPSLSLPQYVIEKRDEQFRKLQQQFPDAGFKLTGDLYQDMTRRLATQREQAEGVRRRASGAGTVGAFVGDMGGGLTDPLVALTLPFGASASAGILRTVLTEAALASGTEAAIQPQVFEFKKNIGSPYSVKEAAANVVFAGAGAGAFAGILKSIPYGYKALLGAYRKRRAAGDLPPPTAREKTAEDFLERYTTEADSNPFQRDLPDSAAVHAENLKTADRHVAEGEIVPQKAIQEPEGAEAPGAIERRQNLKKRQEVDDLQAKVSDLQKRIDDGTATPDELKQALTELDRALHTSEVAPALQNQRAFFNVLRGKDNAAVLFFDLDNFKALNDRFTHDVGDQVIAHVAEIAKEVGEEMGIPVIFHKSGDEFLAGNGVIKAAELKKLGAAIQKRLSNANIDVELADGTVKTLTEVRLSYGVGSGRSTQNSIDAAEKALQADKARRKALGLRTDRLDNVSGEQPGRQNLENIIPKTRRVTREQVRQVENLHEKLHRQPDLLDDTLDAETVRILQENPDFEVPINERVDPDTGEITADTITARELLEQVREEKEAADIFRSCAIGENAA